MRKLGQLVLIGLLFALCSGSARANAVPRGTSSAGETIPFLDLLGLGQGFRLAYNAENHLVGFELTVLRINVHGAPARIRVRCLSDCGQHAGAIRTFRPVSALEKRVYPLAVRIAVAATVPHSVGRYAVLTNLATSQLRARDLACLPPGSLRPVSCAVLKRRYKLPAPPSRYSLSVAIAGEGLGTVSGPTIACPSACTASYPSGANVEVSAKPTSGSLFAGWSGACTGNSGCTIVMAADQQVQATFTPIQNGPPYSESAGSETQTWTDYENGSGTEGPDISQYETVGVTCKVVGLVVDQSPSDPAGDPWWYEIASAPWNDEYFASADAFYNNGASSGSLVGTPLYDPNVPTCPGTTTPTKALAATQLDQFPRFPHRTRG
jgi:Divergent InlB B-repeat domain